MSAPPIERPLKLRLILAGVLALCAITLAAAERLVGTRGPQEETAGARQAAEARIGATLDSLLLRYDVSRGEVRVWRPTVAGKPAARLDSRVLVGPGFLSVNFNHDLNRRLAGTGAHVVATERSKDRTVTMHIVRGGATMRSIAFVTDPER
jgi:hypothetical protein